MLQWFMGALAPPSLACLGAHDGLADAYRAGTYHGGIPCDFFPGYWWYQNRFINRYPASGPSRDQDTDLTRLLAEHPTYDDFWRERSAFEVLDRIKVPLYSSGVWGKMQLHTRGNIDGYLRAPGPKSCACPACRMPGRRRRNSPASNSTRTCCCRSTITTSKARAPIIWRGRMSNTRCAAPT